MTTEATNLTTKGDTTMRNFRINTTNGSLICKHRDLSCCPTCADAHEEVVEVIGAHYWIADKAERDEYAELVASRV